MQNLSTNHGLQLIVGLSLVILVYIAMKLLAGIWHAMSVFCCPKASTTRVVKQELDSKGYRSTFGSHTCTHGPYGQPKVLTILGKSVGVGASPFCETCTVEYFNKYSTKCDKCGDVICPGMPCAQVYSRNAVDGAEEKLLTVCLKSTCNTNPGLYQQWGEGKINDARFGRQ